MKLRSFLHTLIAFVFVFAQAHAQRSSGSNARPAPSAAQLAWHDTEFYFFIHFGPNTFTNKEWGEGTEPESIFNPTDLDCEQWCRVAKLAGARGIVITAKHHDGFCLWPSRYSTHTVRESPWKAGKGDVLRELSDACKKHGLKFGVYLSPWDRNHPKYGTPEYNDVYANTLTELLTGYGELFEVWWDGANGEGKNGKKQTYDFPRFEKLVKKYQPNAVIFSDIGPGCRWAGNEQGTVNETNWCTLDTAGFGRGATGPATQTLQTGQENGKLWIPAECDVSIRPGWFYHSEEDNQVKTPETLFQIYLKSIGRGGNLILNIPPDRRGRIHENDSLSLQTFGKIIEHGFNQNLAFKKPAIVSERSSTSIKQLTDGSKDTYFQFLKRKETNDFGSVDIDLQVETSFNCLKINEKIKKTGQRVKSFSLQIWKEGAWVEVCRSTTIGARKILVFPPVKTNKVRLIIHDAIGFAEIGELGLYAVSFSPK
ncbi:MAG: alpha-L-fucosidase [Saprospiraceae bacterium]|nr:alpha-L-fucosidase [Saprospiraceae bacterium]